MLKLGVFRPIHIRDLTPIQRSRIIRCSMFVKLKYTPSNVFIKCKARLEGGGNLQDKSLYTLGLNLRTTNKPFFL